MSTQPVSNQAIPSWWSLLTAEQRLVFGAAATAWFFDSIDQQLFNLARDGAVEDLVRDPAVALVSAPYTTSCFLAGWAVGGLVFGALGDRYGRARMLTITVLLYSLFTGLSAFSTSLTQFCVYRLLTGLGIGGVFGLAVALIADTVPASARAPALGLMQGLSLWGNIGAGLFGMGVGWLGKRHAIPWDVAPWKLFFLVGSLPAFLSLVVLRKLPEPAAWKVSKEASLRRGKAMGSYAALLTETPWAGRAWLALGLCCAGIIGLWGIGNFHPRIVRAIVELEGGGDGNKAYWSSLALLLQNLGGFAGMVVLSRCAERWGRKPAFAVGLTLSFLTTALVFTSLRHLSDIYWMLPLMGFGQLAVFAVYAIYLPELFPTRLRSTGTSFCYNFGRLFAATAPFTLGQLTRRFGSNLEAFRHAGLAVSLVLLVGLATLPFLPETRGEALPED